MSEPNHVPKANHLRFSIVLFAIVVLGASIVFVQRVRQARIDEEIQKQRDEVALARKHSSPDILSTMVAAKPPDIQRKEISHSTSTPSAPKFNEITNGSSNADSAANILPVTAPQQRTPVVSGLLHGTYVPHTISGTIRLSSTPPAEKPIEPLTKDPVCGKLWKDVVPTTRFYVVGSNGELANAFVYIKGEVPYRTPGFLQTTGLLENRNCMFEPYILGVMVNQPLQIRNDDPVLHNIHATPTINPEFNFAQPVQGQINEKVFTKPEVLVRIKCDVHPWMFAYVGVVPHPYFAVSDASGHFELNGVPNGTYELEVVHVKAGRQMASVTVSNDAPDVTFIFDVPK